MQPNYLTLTDARQHVLAGELTPSELVEACLAQIEEQNPFLNAFITVMSEHAREQAAYATAAFSRGEVWGTLHGLPIAVKDLIDVEGVKTTAGSPFLKDNIAQADAPVITNLKAAGAIIIGKTHLHEYAVGATNVNPHYGPARNPWNPDHSSGGSSGGSAVAVSSGMALAALGTDTGGSVRIPSALCNLTGLRPARHQVSTRGVIPMSWTLDAVGPMTRTIHDLALLLDAMIDGPTRYVDAVDTASAPLRFGLPSDDLYWLDTSTEIVMLIRQAAETLVDLGMSQKDVSIPQLREMYRAAGIISISEAAAYHYDRLQSDPGRFGIDVRQRLEGGMRHSAMEYARSRQQGRAWRAFLRGLFKQVDVVVLPVTPITAPPIVEATPTVSKQLLRFNYPFSLSGLPCLALPIGFSDDRLPVGMQLVAPAVETLLQVAAKYQRNTDWHQARPNNKI